MHIDLRLTAEIWLRLLIALIVAGVAGWRHDLLPDRRLVRLALLLAAAYFVHGFATVPVNDDETYYLATAWDAWQGTTNGDLPLRHLVYWPIVLPPLSPAGTVLLGRLAMCAAGLFCAWGVRRISHRLGGSLLGAGLAAALTLIWLRGEADWSFTRPEYFASVFLMASAVALIAPPADWSRRRSAVVAFLCVGWMAGTSHRHVVVVPFAALALWLETRGEPLGRVAGWMAAGVALSLIPTLLYLLKNPVLEKIIRHHLRIATVMRSTMIPPFYVGARLPLVALGSLLAAASGLASRRPAMSALMAGCLLAALLNPIKLPYALSSFLCASAIAAGCVFATLPRAAVATLFTLTVLLNLLHHDRGLLLSPETLRGRVADLRQQLALLDWLARAAGSDPVLCVAPYHPLRVTNGWNVFNAHYYCYVSRALKRDLEPRLEATLLSGRPAIIQWDPWPEYSEQPNLMAWAIAHDLVSPAAAPDVKRVLRERYRLVRWPVTLPRPFGGGRFLVRRDRPWDGASEAAPDPALDGAVH